MTNERTHRGGSGAAHGIGAGLAAILAALGRFGDDAARVGARYGDDLGRAAIHSSHDIGRMATSGDDLLRYADEITPHRAAGKAGASDMPQMRPAEVHSRVTGYRHEIRQFPFDEVVEPVFSEPDIQTDDGF
jgi:hypothetical protein